MKDKYKLLLVLPLLFVSLVSASDIKDDLYVRNIGFDLQDTRENASYVLSLESPHVISYIAKSGDSATYSYIIPADTAHEFFLASGLNEVTCYIGIGKRATNVDYDTIILPESEGSRLMFPPLDHEEVYFIAIYAQKENANFYCGFGLLPNPEAAAVGSKLAECHNVPEDAKLNETYSTTLETECGKYYRLILSNDLPIYINLLIDIIASNSGFMYIKKDSLPTFTEYDNYIFYDKEEQSSLGIIDRRHTYYIWFYPYSNVKDQIKWKIDVTTTDECINKCSGKTHGICNGSECICNSDYHGVLCEEMNHELLIGKDVFGSLDQQYWNYYRFFTDAQSAIIKLQHGQNEDCDLFVANDRKPTASDFTLRNISFTSSSTIVINQPIGHIWYIGVLGISKCSYKLTVDTEQCPTFCTLPRGTCQPDTFACTCSPGYYGDTCTQPAGNISLNCSISSILTAHADDISFLYTPPNVLDYLVFTVVSKETHNEYPFTSLSVYLYDKNGGIINSWEEKDKNLVHVVHFTNNKSEGLPFLIVVKRDAYATGVDIPFELVVWSPSS